MSNTYAKVQNERTLCRTLFIRLVLVGLMMAAFVAVRAQAPTSTQTPEIDVMFGGYKVTAAAEFGWRWRSLDGNANQYRSTLNYGQGFRTFDSNLLMQTQEGKGKYFDTLLVSNSGWGSDPTGMTRVDVEKTGVYKFTSNVRKVAYFNNIFNFVNPINLPNSEHRSDVRHTFGDFDFIWHPQSERLRVNFGVSFNNNGGTGGTTERFFSDEFAVNSHIDAKSMDYRFGAEGKLFGFDWGVNQGFRTFMDRSYNYLDAPSQGNTTTNQSRLDTFRRSYPTDGNGSWTNFSLHRLFADRLDFTGRLIYATTSSDSSMNLSMTGRDNTNPVGILVTSDEIRTTAHSRRPQTRGDLGVTYAITDRLRISDTFSFDQFSINGREQFNELWVKASGSERSKSTSLTQARTDSYRRYLNTLEGDYQFSTRFSLHLGYRYTDRSTHNRGFDINCTSTTTAASCPPSAPTRVNYLDEEQNSTNAFLGGMKIKPTQDWVVYWDVEHGQADNVFSRLENYRYTNFRIRSRLAINKFTLNLAAVTNDNENPSEPQSTVTLPPSINFITDIKRRFYSGSVDWEPGHSFFLSSGYTYRNINSHTPIVLPVSGATGGYVYGNSQYFMRDHYFFFDVSAKPMPRLSLFGSYRIDLDHGQGGLVQPPITITVADLVSSYPMQFTTPEFRAAIRLTDNIDWNIGYQYYDYKDRVTPFQNYRAHLPYTSLRIYFGGRAVDR